MTFLRDLIPTMLALLIAVLATSVGLATTGVWVHASYPLVQ
ncbi:hypothetical protein [Pseudovibrio exalbescens]|nr:hypothetical protein [Pseudovibrio exalbescens]